jgi:hypothetical protein
MNLNSNKFFVRISFIYFNFFQCNLLQLRNLLNSYKMIVFNPATLCAYQFRKSNRTSIGF